MAEEKVLGFRIEVRGTEKETADLVKLGDSINQLKARLKLLNDVEKKNGSLTAKQKKERQLLNTQLKANRSSYNALNRQILQNNNVTKKSSGFISKMGKSIASSVGRLAAMTLGFAALSRFVTSTVKIFKDFQAANSKLESILKATKNEMTSLKEQAIALGSSTAFTASQVTELQTEFAKLGFPTNEILQMTEATLNGAAALGSELGEQAALTGATLKQYQLDASEAARVNDVLAKAASSSALDFSKLSTALPIVGATADAAGVTLERTTALLGTLSDRGLDASSSGTALRNMFLELSKKGLTYEEAMEKINTATDKNKTAMELFGKRGATAGVILAGTADSVENLEEKLIKANGAAKAMADTMLDNWTGDLTIAQSAWEGFVLSLENGEGAIGRLLRTATQGFTQLLTNFGDDTIAEKLGLERGLFQDFNESQRELLEFSKKTSQMVAEISNGKTTLSEFLSVTTKLREKQKALNRDTEEGEAKWRIYDETIKKLEANATDLVNKKKELQVATEENTAAVEGASEQEIAAEQRKADKQKAIQEKAAEDAKKLEEDLQKELRRIKIENETEGRAEERALLELSFTEKLEAITGNSETEKQLIKAIKEQQRQATKELEAQYKVEDDEKLLAERQLEVENQLILAGEDFEARRLVLEQQRQLELEQTGLTKSQIDVINKKYDDIEKADSEKLAQIKQAQRQAELSAVAGALNAAAGLMKDGSNTAKVLASGAAIINTYAAATAALAPPPIGAGPVVGPLLAGTAIATGLANVAKINGVTFEDGGLVEGASHSQGGIQMFHKGGSHLGEMEGNEYIISAKRTKEIGVENLDAMNFGSGTMNGFFANGGSVPSVSSISSVRNQTANALDMDRLAGLISNEMKQAIVRTPVVNNATETFDVAADVLNTESSLNFG